MKKYKVYLKDILDEYPEPEEYQKFYTYVMELSDFKMEQGSLFEFMKE